MFVEDVGEAYLQVDEELFRAIRKDYPGAPVFQGRPYGAGGKQRFYLLLLGVVVVSPLLTAP